jgi:hypothetical protein
MVRGLLHQVLHQEGLVFLVISVQCGLVVLHLCLKRTLAFEFARFLNRSLLPLHVTLLEPALIRIQTYQIRDVDLLRHLIQRVTEIYSLVVFIRA